jgi:hypothetical protein
MHQRIHPMINASMHMQALALAQNGRMHAHASKQIHPSGHARTRIHAHMRGHTFNGAISTRKR